MRFGIHWIELVATINVLGDNNGVISDYNKNSHLLSVNSSQVTFLGLYVRDMLGNIAIALGE